MHPLMDFKFLNFCFHFKNLKSIGFAVSFIALYLSLSSTSTVRDFSHRNVNISHRTVNPPTEHKQFIISQGEKSLTVLVLVNAKYRRRTLYFLILRLKIKILKRAIATDPFSHCLLTFSVICCRAAMVENCDNTS
jgi:hypothetical protein